MFSADSKFKNLAKILNFLYEIDQFLNTKVYLFF